MGPTRAILTAGLALVLAISPVQVQAQESETDTAAAAPKRIHVIVALCDNEHQGIAKVGAKIGNGDDPYGNLYWGCSDGMWRFFAKSSDWKLIESKKVKPDPEKADPFEGKKILETLTFHHATSDAILVAEAWRGREIKAATVRFFELLESNEKDAPELVAFIGHNGLMDFYLPEGKGEPAGTVVESVAKKRKDAVVLCCRSRIYFNEKLAAHGARPILMTEQLMYPGSFLLKAALDGWLAGESRDQIRERAAKAYAKNQKISVKAALGVFSRLDDEVDSTN